MGSIASRPSLDAPLRIGHERSNAEQSHNSKRGSMEAEKLQSQPGQALLPLDEPRVIAIQDGKFTYTFHFARISQADWSQYFNKIIFKTRNDGTKQVTMIEMDVAGIELFESTLQRVEGYSGDFATRQGWQAKIPPRHAQKVAELLRLAGPSQEQGDACDPENVEVQLDALWSQAKPGEMTLYKGLVHRFAPPSVEQKRRYYNAGSQSIVVGGSRNGTTIYGKRHQALLDIYDELIVDVDGYSVGGTPLGHGLDVPRAQAVKQIIVREMDAFHKFMAAQQLFAPLAPAGEAVEEELAA
jgi:hypothetical protein